MTTPAAESFDPRPHMLRVLWPLLAGVLLYSALQGPSVLLNWLLLSATLLSLDQLLLKLQQSPANNAAHTLLGQPLLGEGSSLISAALLTLALPAYSPWWLVLSAGAFAATFGKGLFGGYARNPFNPAMLGYAFVLVMFPAALLQGANTNSLTSLFSHSTLIDGSSHATALDALRHNQQFTIAELFSNNPGFGWLGDQHAQWLNLWFLLTGLWLIKAKVIRWQIPVGVLLGLFSASLIGWNGSGSDSNGSPIFHLFSGASMLCAFFIATEPVTGPKNLRACWFFALGIGVLIYLLRVLSNYPDGVAFAVLLMGLGAPWLDRWQASR